MQGNEAQLNLLLGTVYKIDFIVLEKFDGNKFVPIQQLNFITSTGITFIDNAVTQGANTYRVKIVLAGGGVVYSESETVYYFASEPFIVYPNPVSQQETINILSSDNSGDVQLRIFNAMGQKVYERIVDDVRITIPAVLFQRGLYFLRFTGGVQKSSSLKLLIQ